MKKNLSELEPLVPTLGALQRLIERFESRGIVIGGAAICLLGQPRLTADVDAMLLVTNQELPTLLEAAFEIGFSPRRKDYEAFARRNRIILLHHPETGTDVDISLGSMPLEIEMVDRSQVIRYGTLRLRLPTIEDLIILKAIAHRPKDMMDIGNLIELYPKIDRKRIQKWVEEYAELMETPELWTDLAVLLKK